MNNEFVFRKSGDHLEFVGDFDKLYLSEADPWQQSGEHGPMADYYRLSRRRLQIEIWKLPTIKSALEVGCGLGYSTKFISRFQSSLDVEGMDISGFAINGARLRMPTSKFYVADIAAKDFTHDKTYDAVILNQMFWYILERFDTAMINAFHLIKPGGTLVISNGFLQDQQWGKGLCDGFNGMVRMLANDYHPWFTLVSARYDDSNSLALNDGIVVLRKMG